MPASGLEPPVSEAELHGFVDGGLDRGRREAVQAFLAASPADAARVETWRGQNDKIRAAFASVEAIPPPWPSPHAPGAGGAAPAGREPKGSGQSKVRAPTPMWRERWFAQLIGLAFASGVVLTAGAAYLDGRADPPQGMPLSSSGPAVGASEAFTVQAMAALRAFDQPPAAPGLSPKEKRRAQDGGAPLLPNLPVSYGLKLAGVRAMPGEQGQMLCLFYTKPDAGKLALCAEKTPGSSETSTRLSGPFPSAAISWRQRGANYALAGTLSEPELRALADAVRAQVEAFDGKE
jgi:anti-sigma factor RsiW